MDYVLYEGSRLPVYLESELRRLDRVALREHALTLYRSLGHSKIGMTVPHTHDQLFDWIQRVQGMHLEPLRGLGLRPSRSLGDLAGYEMLRDGDFRGLRTSKVILGESHSRHAMLLAQNHPMLAAAILREINDGIQMFHDGRYGGDIWLSQRKLAEDIYKGLCSASFTPYRNKFLNFNVTVGNTGYAGNMPCFRYKIAYPEKWSHIYDTAYISVFFTLKEVELRMMVGDANPYDESGFETPLLDSYAVERGRSLSPDNYALDRYGLSPGWGRRSLSPVLPSEFVTLGDRQLRLYKDFDLRRLDRLALRQHAEDLYRTLGHAKIGMSIPTREAELVDWIAMVQRSHLDPLGQSTSLGYDRFGDRVAKTVAYDPYGDKITSKTVSDGLGDRITTKTFTDPYGDKITTKTETDLFGDKKVSRSERDRFGNEVKSSTFTDPYGDKRTTRTLTDPWGDKFKSSTNQDRFGDKWKTNSLSDAYGDRLSRSSYTNPLGLRSSTLPFSLRSRLYR